MTRFLKSLLILFAVVATSCGGSEPSHITSDAMRAQEQGRADAKALSEAGFTTERDLHAALLSVKSREWKMRQEGDSIGASAYVEAFRTYLEENDNTLAGKIF